MLAITEKGIFLKKRKESNEIPFLFLQNLHNKNTYFGLLYAFLTWLSWMKAIEQDTSPYLATLRVSYFQKSLSLSLAVQW